MALIKCMECKADISNKAQACPKCGAKPPKSRAILYALLALPVLFFIWAMARTPSPEEKARSSARAAIDLCWKEQKKKSNDAQDAQFIAGACELMESRFEDEFGRKP